jgi:hypothetical protein
MIRSKDQPLISNTQFVTIVVVTVTIFLIVDFGRRATASYYVSEAERQLKDEIAVELTRQAELTAYRDYVQRDEYVEQWAREQAHMVRVGDQPVIPITPPVSRQWGNVAQPVDDAAEAPQPPNWYRWWRLFFEVDPWTLQVD